jgi:cytochrome c peroxidase
MRITRSRVARELCAVVLSAVMTSLGVSPAMAQSPGEALTTPTVPMELPIEVEIELSPAGSLKQAATWPELYRLLKNPYAVNCPLDNPLTPDNESYYCTATIQRRPGFGAAMPPLNIYSPGYNFLTGQPLRRRTTDGEVSWDQPGPLFDPEEDVALDAFSTPTLLRAPVGHLVACPNPGPEGAYQAADIPGDFCNGKPSGSLVVFNPTENAVIPPNGTVVATAALVSGQLLDEDGDAVTELEAPVNEEDFFRPASDTTAVPGPLRPYIGRPGAEILGKALFWDMQVGSDGVQSCGSCHFHAGVDSRTKGQLNPNVNGPLGNMATLEVKPANTDVVPADFPFHKSGQDDLSNDSDDVMSSMGVSRFKLFRDIPRIGLEHFLLPAVNGVRALAPDLGTLASDPVPANEGLRRVEPRNTPTMHGAAFNFDNFWDVRARFSYNGGSVFGPSDPTPHIFINPDLTPNGDGAFAGATMGDIRDDLEEEDPEIAEQPVRIKFSSLASQSQGPPLSDFEMSFAGRNWAKIGKKLLQGDNGPIQQQGNGAPQQPGTNRAQAVVPLANQLVSPADSRLGPFSNQNTLAAGPRNRCAQLGRPTAPGKPGLCISYPDMIRLAFGRQFWNRNNRHLVGSAAVCTAAAVNGTLTPAGCDPFDGYVLTVANGAANPTNRSQFTQMEANFSLFFGLSVQAYEELLIPDHTPLDRFFDRNPHAGVGVGEPGDQAVLYPTLIRDMLDDGRLNGSPGANVTLIPDDPATPWYDAFGPDELFGFDLFAGANLTAALAPRRSVDPRSGRDRNPRITNSVGQTIRVGSNPFTRSAKCMLCHLGPEQTDHSINITHGVLKNDAEFEYPTPPRVPDPTTPATFADGFLPAPEPSGSSRTVVGIILEEEVGEGVAQDAVEVEPRDFAVFDDPATPWDDRIIAQESNFAFGDQGVYNIGLRPIADDLGRGGNDPFGWPLALTALTLKNIGGVDFEPCDGDDDDGDCMMPNFDPFNIEGEEGQQGFEETGDGEFYPGTTHTLQSINPGYERDPNLPQLPEYMVPWIHSLPAGELHPQIDEMAGMVPNTITPPNGGPGIEFPEIMFGADFHCAAYDPATFGDGPPNFGWGPPSSTARLCPQNQSGVAGNFQFPAQGTWPVPNRVMRNGAFKAPPLRNVEMTGPFFHTGSFLTLRQVVDFYFRGGDFPGTNRSSRDPHVVNLEMQAFAFGPTQGAFNGFNLLELFDCSEGAPDLPGVDPITCGSFDYLTGSFGDGLPDTVFLYDQYPDSDHPLTPEPVFASRDRAIEDAKNALVKFMLALTDPRVKLERAPFDRPEIYVPIDGAAPENTGGPAQLTALSGGPCEPEEGTGLCFRRIPEVGAAGSGTPLPGFLGVTSVPPGAPGFTCDSGVGPVSHFCSAVN